MSKKVTHEDYVTELAVKNPTIRVIREYTGRNTKIKHYCTKHDVNWEIMPSSALQGRGYKLCTREKHRKSAASKTHEQYIEEVRKLNPDIKVIDKYINARKKIKHYCKKHDIYWDALPSNVLKGCGCSKCGNEKIRYKNKKSHEEYIKEVSLISPHIEVLEKYVNMKSPILHKCKVHNIQWRTMPESILQGCSCQECGKEKSRNALCKSNEEYIEELKKNNPNIISKEKYINSNTPILHKCLIDGYEWRVRPANILSGTGCPKCSIEKNRKNALKTHQQYIEAVNKANPYIEVIEEYKGSGIAIKHYCKKHDVYWDSIPSSVLKGCGCAKCGVEKRNSKSRKTHKEYVEELKLINPYIVVLETYVNAHTPIKHKCNVDGYEWFAKPNNILSGKGCPKCSNKIKITHEDYIRKVLLANQDIEVLEEYINMATPILHKCKIHDVKWKTSPERILHGCGCSECCKEKISKASVKSNEEYIVELKKKHPNIIAISKYTNAKTPVRYRCLIDGYEWEAKPSNVLFRTGCPKCSGNIKKTHNEYVNEVYKINPDIEVVGKYINAKTPILHKCLIDGYEWNAIPSGILSGNGCPRCHESSGERQIRQWLEKHNIKYIYQKVFSDCRDKHPLPFDFYLPDNVMCIEYDGGQHTKPVDHFGGIQAFERTIKHDNMKNDYCKNNGISLLRIPYFKNVEEELNNFLFI